MDDMVYNKAADTVDAVKLDDDKWFEDMCQIFNFSIQGPRLLEKTQDMSGRGQFNTSYGWYVTNGPLLMCCDMRVKTLNETEATPEMCEMIELLRSAKYMNLSRKELNYAKRYYKESRKLWLEKSGEKRTKMTPELRIHMQESNLFNFRLYRMPQGYSFSSVYLNDAITAVGSLLVMALGIVPIYGKEIPILRVWGSRGIVWLWPRHREAGLIAESVRNAYRQAHTDVDDTCAEQDAIAEQEDSAARGDSIELTENSEAVSESDTEDII